MPTLVLLRDRPDAISALATGYEAEWPDWYGPQGPGDAQADLLERAGAGPIPFALAALQHSTPIGVAAVAAASIATHAHLSPWLVGLWVAPSSRGEGVASALVDAAAAEARALCIQRLHVATRNGRTLFERLGWRWFEKTGEDGQELAVLALDLA